MIVTAAVVVEPALPRDLRGRNIPIKSLSPETVVKRRETVVKLAGSG